LTLTNANTFSGGVTINPGATVLLTNPASAGGTGPITDNGTLGVGITANNAILPNAISGPGIINIYETVNSNLQLGGVMSGFTGTINAPASASTAKLQILTTNVALPASATINLAAGGTLFVANPGVVIPCTLNVGGFGNSETYGALRLEAGALISGPVILGGSTTIGNNQAGPTKLATISGVISDGGNGFSITKTPPAGTIVLSGANTYSGSTFIDGGTLSLGAGGSINDSTNISIALGGTFDVSAYSTYTLSSVATLSASGSGTASTAASISNSAAGGVISLGASPVHLTFTPLAFNGDSTHPSLYIPAGTLSLNGNPFTVNNEGGSPLGIGTYLLAQQASGSILSAGPCPVTVTGSGLAAGTAASIQVTGGSVNLIVANAVTPVPGITPGSIVHSGSTLIFSGTNGPANGTYYLLTSTNLALPVSQWTAVLTNSFSATGAFSVTNTNTPSPSYFIIATP